MPFHDLSICLSAALGQGGRIEHLCARAETLRKSLKKASEDQLNKHWRLLMGKKVLDDRARHLIVADTISHLAHHRGQLTVYLRLNDKPVPAIYGASADSGW